MRVVGTVAPDEVPSKGNEPARAGQWTGLAARAAHETQKGRVLVVEMENKAEYAKMRRGTTAWLARNKYTMKSTVVDAKDDRGRPVLKVFIEVRPIEVHGTALGTALGGALEAKVEGNGQAARPRRR